MSSRLEIAEDLAARGLSLIPLEARGKKPVAKWTLFQEAHPTADNLRSWFSDERDLNIGIVTGKISGVVVVDVDSPEAATWAEAHLPASPMRTRTAKGEHWFYRHPGVDVRNRVKISTGDERVALDVRGDGGYVVAPGSVHETGVTYEREGLWPEVEMLPLFDPRWIEAEAVQHAAGVSTSRDGAPATAVPRDERIRQARNYVRAADPAVEGQGGDAQTYTLCCRVARGFDLDEGGALDVLSDWNQTCSPPWAEQELASKVRNALRYGDEPLGGRLRQLRIASHREGRAATTRVDSATDKSGRVSSPEGGWPAPMDDEAFRGPIGQLVRALEPHTEADPAALLVQALVSFGSAAGRHAYFEAEGAKHYLNLFAVVVGATAKGRKGTSWAHTKRIFDLADEGFNSRVVGQLASGEGLAFAVRDPSMGREAVKVNGRRTGEYDDIEVDPGVADKRLLVVETEFANALRVMGREGNTLSAVIREAWDSGVLGALTKNNRVRATDAHISIIGHITADELRRYLTLTEAGNGFGNRFLWVCARRSKRLPEGGRFHEENSDEMTAALREALRFARSCGELRRDERARGLWREMYDLLSEAAPGMLGAMLSRAEAQVMRLACLYAVAEQSPFISPPHLRAAHAVWRYCEASAHFIFGQSLGDPDADEVLSALRAAGPEGMTRTEIGVQVFGKNRSSAQIGRVLQALEAGAVAYRQVDREGAGRPTERWFATSAGSAGQAPSLVA